MSIVSMRDHTKLRAFELGHRLAVEVYRVTRAFPREAMFGLTSQLRRAAVSVASNIVEGCARDSEADYIRFLDIAYGSSREVQYQLELATCLGFVPPAARTPLAQLASETCRVLNSLIRSLRAP